MPPVAAVLPGIITFCCASVVLPGVVQLKITPGVVLLPLIFNVSPAHTGLLVVYDAFILPTDTCIVSVLVHPWFIACITKIPESIAGVLLITGFWDDEV